MRNSSFKGTWDFGQILKGTYKIVDLSAAGEKSLTALAQIVDLSAAGEQKGGERNKTHCGLCFFLDASEVRRFLTIYPAVIQRQILVVVYVFYSFVVSY